MAIKRILIVIISILVLTNISEAQQRSSRNGECFTPKDSIKVLLVCVGFGPYDSLVSVSGWHKDNDFPNAITKYFTILDDTNYVTKKLYFCNSNFDFFINYIRV